jgi:hypothetical protein
MYVLNSMRVGTLFIFAFALVFALVIVTPTNQNSFDQDQLSIASFSGAKQGVTR